MPAKKKETAKKKVTTKAASLAKGDTKKVTRSSASGKFVPKELAKKEPAATVTQTVTRGRKPRVRKAKHLSEPVPEINPLDAAREAQHAELNAQAPALSEAATATTAEQAALNEAASAHDFEMERKASHAAAVASNR